MFLPQMTLRSIGGNFPIVRPSAAGSEIAQTYMTAPLSEAWRVFRNASGDRTTSLLHVPSGAVR